MHGMHDVPSANTLLLILGRHHQAPNTAPTCYVYGVRTPTVYALCMRTMYVEVISYLIPISYYSWYGWYDVSYH